MHREQFGEAMHREQFGEAMHGHRTIPWLLLSRQKNTE